MARGKEKAQSAWRRAHSGKAGSKGAGGKERTTVRAQVASRKGKGHRAGQGREDKNV